MSKREEDTKNERTIIKIIILGHSNVGKTAIMKRYTTGKFNETRRATVGSDFMTKVVIVNNAEIIVQIWDTAGQERFHQGTLGNAFYRGANGCFLAYDVSNGNSIEQLSQWRDEMISRIDKDQYIPIIVVGNKKDLQNETNKHIEDEVLEWCQINGYGHVATSAKDDVGIDVAMQVIAALAIEHHNKFKNSLVIADKVNISEMYSKNKSGCC
jgi:Ras-related protein Rab-7A